MIRVEVADGQQGQILQPGSGHAKPEERAATRLDQYDGSALAPDANTCTASGSLEQTDCAEARVAKTNTTPIATKAPSGEVIKRRVTALTNISIPPREGCLVSADQLNLSSVSGVRQLLLPRVPQPPPSPHVFLQSRALRQLPERSSSLRATKEG